MERIYIAGPYSHPDLPVRKDRLASHATAAGLLMNQGHLVFCPIAHSGLIVEQVEMPEGPDFWLWQCDSFLRKWATMMIVLPLKGWEFSFGLRHEIELALDMKVKCIFGQNLKDAALKYRNGYRTGKGYKDFDALVEQELLDGLVIKGVDYRELEPGEKGSVLYMEKEE